MFEETLVIGEMADGTPVTVTVQRLFPTRYQEKAIAVGMGAVVVADRRGDGE